MHQLTEGIQAVHWNGGLCPLSAVKISAFDRGFVFGHAIYEVMLVCNGKVRALDRHLKRLTRNLQIARIEPPPQGWRWAERIEELLAVTQWPTATGSLYLHVTGGDDGSAKRSLLPSGKETPTILIVPQLGLSEEETNTPLCCSLQQDVRWQRGDIKVPSLMGAMLGVMSARDGGTDDVIFHRDGWVTEASSANVIAFFCQDDVTVAQTPPLSSLLLPGITRELLSEILEDAHIKLDESPLSVQKLLEADEVCLTGTLRGATPVTHLLAEGQRSVVGDGRPGKHWRQLQDLYSQLVGTG